MIIKKNLVIVSSMVLNLDENKNLKLFMNTFDLECLIKKYLFSIYQSKLHWLNFNKWKGFFITSNVLEVGSFDHHSLTVTPLRSKLVQCNAKIKLYRDYSSFSVNLLSGDLDKNLKSSKSILGSKIPQRVAPNSVQ